MVTARKPKPRKSASASAGKGSRRRSAGESSLVGHARQLRAWTGSALDIAGAAAATSLGAAKVLLVRPEQRSALARAGQFVRRARQSAGLSLREVGAAIDLNDPALLELVESGKVALPFEVILRLAAVLGRNDPVSFVMRVTRSYSPELWRTLEALGIGRVVVQSAREREFANLYRASDAARTLDDKQFARVLRFVEMAFELALTLHVAETGSRPRRGQRDAGKRG